QELLVPGPNVDQGYGRVNMETATSPLANQYYTMVLDAPGVAQGESVSYAVSGGIHKVTLVYTDAPGSSASAKALVNNLDLEVKMNDGRILKSTSTLNNSEQIVAQQGEISEVVVRGVNIPQGRDGVLPFALVVSR
ncbi:MAG: serine protease, partial [Bdellovibrionales bacterium]|nr:serine protease [Bdellovibrionales bacterium]